VRTGNSIWPGLRFDQRPRATARAPGFRAHVSSSRSAPSSQTSSTTSTCSSWIDPKSTAQSQRTGRITLDEILPEPERRRREAATRGPLRADYTPPRAGEATQSTRRSRNSAASARPNCSAYLGYWLHQGATERRSRCAVPRTAQNVPDGSLRRLTSIRTRLPASSAPRLSASPTNVRNDVREIGARLPTSGLDLRTFLTSNTRVVMILSRSGRLDGVLILPGNRYECVHKVKIQRGSCSRFFQWLRTPRKIDETLALSGRLIHSHSQAIICRRTTYIAELVARR